MQTNKEFLDALGIRPEDGFAVVEMRRVLAEMHRKPMVLELETHAVGEPVSNFFLPWDTLDFVYRLEKRLGVKIERSVDVDELPESWRAGPAVEMPLGEWMEIALRYFIEPIRAELKPPENWTPLEPEEQGGKPISFWQKLRCFSLLLCFLILPASAIMVSGGIDLMSCFGLCGEELAEGCRDYRARLLGAADDPFSRLLCFIPVVLLQA